MLFLGPCIDNLGSVVIIRDGGILHYTTGKLTQKPELHQRQNNSQKESKTSPSCSLKSTTKQQKMEFKMESTRDVFYVRREVDLMKTAKVNAYIMHIFGKIEL